MGEPIRRHSHFIFVTEPEWLVLEIPGSVGTGFGESTFKYCIFLLLTVSFSQGDHNSGGNGCKEAEMRLSVWHHDSANSCSGVGSSETPVWISLATGSLCHLEWVTPLFGESAIE